LTSRLIIATQLACVVIGVALVVRVRDQLHGAIVTELLALAGFAGVVTVAGWFVQSEEQRTAVRLTRSMAEERRLTATLEQAVVSRTTALEDAQRVLQRMWWLGQQITLELNSQ